MEENSLGKNLKKHVEIKSVSIPEHPLNPEEGGHQLLVNSGKTPECRFRSPKEKLFC